MIELPAEAQDLTCPMCKSATLIDRQCKRLCENCGYVESCEDLFAPQIIEAKSTWSETPID